MDVLVREVQEERTIAIRIDEADRGAREIVGHGLLIETDVGREFLLAAPVRHRELVVRVRHALEEVEAVARGQVLAIVGEVAEVPLADHAGGVARDPQRLREGDLRGGHAGDPRIVEVARAEPRAELRGRERDALRKRHVAREDDVADAGAHRIAAGEEPGPRRRADRRTRVGVREADARLRRGDRGSVSRDRARRTRRDRPSRDRRRRSARCWACARPACAASAGAITAAGGSASFAASSKTAASMDATAASSRADTRENAYPAATSTATSKASRSPTRIPSRSLTCAARVATTFPMRGAWVLATAPRRPEQPRRFEAHGAPEGRPRRSARRTGPWAGLPS